MSTVTLTIDGREVQAERGTPLLQVARAAGARIPTLCHDEELKPSGACRLCLVEVQTGKKTRTVASCVYPAEAGIVVRTSTPKIEKHRKLILELLFPTATKLAREHGVTSSRFTPSTPDCNLCGLCVRYCAEVAKKNVLYFKGRGVDRQIAFVPGAALECAQCRKCWGLCTGGLVVSQHGLAAYGSVSNG